MTQHDFYVDNDHLYNIDYLSENPADSYENFRIIQSAIRFCKKNDLAGLRFSKGTFPIYNEKAVSLCTDLLTGKISPTDYGYWNIHKNVLFEISDYPEFSVIGDNTTFLANGLIGIFDFSNIRQVKLSGVRVDWINPLFFIARIDQICDHNVTVNLLDNEKLYGGEPIVSFQNFDRTTKMQKGVCVFEGVSNLKKEPDDLYSFTSEDVTGLSVGDGIIARYIYNFAPVIHFYCCEMAQVEDVTLNAGVGMGVIAHKCGDLSFHRYRNLPSDGRVMSTNTDATHFISCYGKIQFNDCFFEGMGDDAVNVHSFYLTVKEITDEKTVIAYMEADSQDQIVDLPDESDQIEFTDRKTLFPFASGQISRVNFDESSKTITISCHDPLPKSVLPGCLIANTGKTAQLLFENCTVRNIRGRALLIQTRGAEIKHNLFEKCTGQGVHIDTADGWMESIGTRNVTVSSNRFVDCGYGMTKYCDAVAVVVETEAEQPAVGVHKDIVISNNYIEGDQIGIKVMCADGVTISGNTFVNCKKDCDLSFCDHVKMQ